VLSEAGHEVTRAQGGPVDLLLFHLDPEAADYANSQETLASLRAAPRGGPPVLVLATLKGDPTTHRLLLASELDNFLAVARGQSVEPQMLTLTARRLVERDVHGLEPYFGRSRITTMGVRGSRDKRTAVDAVETLARRLGFHPQVVHGIAVVADEILSNALYNAPVDLTGRPRFAHLRRSTPVVLAPTEEIQFFMASNGERVGLGARDPFGSLELSSVLARLKRCAARENYRVEKTSAGAGLGLYYVFNLVHHMVVQVTPGQCTEVIGFVSVTNSYRDFVTRPRSLNLIVSDTA
jgi:hypothetical protein